MVYSSYYFGMNFTAVGIIYYTIYIYTILLKKILKNSIDACKTEVNTSFHIMDFLLVNLTTIRHKFADHLIITRK